MASMAAKAGTRRDNEKCLTSTRTNNARASERQTRKMNEILIEFFALNKHEIQIKVIVKNDWQNCVQEN